MSNSPPNHPLKLFSLFHYVTHFQIGRHPQNTIFRSFVGDGAMYWYLQEIVVHPDYQGKGIGKSIVNRLIEHVKSTAIPGSQVTIGLSAAKGKDAFYEKFGFVSRPTESCGPGMEKRLTIDV